MRDRRKRRRERHGETHRAEGGGCLKQTQVHRHVFDKRNGARTAEDDRHADDRERDRIHDAARLDGSSEGCDRRPSAQRADRAEREHCHRHGLKAARRRAGRAADQHEHARDRLRGVGQRALVDGVEARRAQRHRLERRREQPVRHAHAAERRRITPLEQQRQHKAAAEQYARHGEYELAVQAEAAEAPVIPHIAPYKKAETAEHDERHDGQIHERVVRIVHERAERIVRRAHEVEAAVAERRYRMENTHADAAQQPELLHEADGHVIEKNSYPIPPIFTLMAKKGNVDEQMMYNTYNMGLGLVIAVDPAQADAAIAAIEAAGEKAYRVGSIEAGEKGVILK